MNGVENQIIVVP